jgi:formylglycine-generating enzyme required for sulfatase activity
MRCVLAAVVLLCVGCGEKSAAVADPSAETSQTETVQQSVTPSDEPKSTVGDSSGKKLLENSIGMKFVLIPKGTFLMGSPPDEEGRDDDERQHEVTMTRDFRIGVHEVTQSQYKRVMGKNPSYFTGDEVAERDPKNGRVVRDVDSANLPVDYVSYDDAVEFCRRLSELHEESVAKRRYRLPTEAEWEYACRAGAKTAFSFGNDAADLGLHAWYYSNSNNMSHAVGGKKPNAFGLYDMHGNVLEWCSDWYDENYYASSPGTDPKGPDSGTHRVLRGGSWGPVPYYVRCALRFHLTPDNRHGLIGIRLVLE